jgi:hypothetical protein
MCQTTEKVHKIKEYSSDTPSSDPYKIIQNCALAPQIAYTILYKQLSQKLHPQNM